MNKVLRFITITLIILFSISGCSAENIPEKSSSDKLKVVTTIFPPYDFVREIGKDKVAVSMLLPPGGEVHSFEPTPKNIIEIQDCDIFIYVGGESDEWVKGVLDSLDTSNIKIISLMDLVNVVEEELVEGMQEEDGELEEDEPAYDEHVWTSPKNAKAIVTAISSQLQASDEKNKDFYSENTENYLKELDNLDHAVTEIVNNAERKTIVFADRFPFRYLADHYGLEYFAAFPGCSSETEASAGTIAFLIDKIKEEEIPVIFHIEFSNEQIADIISEAAGAKKLLLHSAHNVTKNDFENNVSYMSLMKKNLTALKEALE